MNTLRIVWSEINGQALEARRTALREAARTNTNNPFIRPAAQNIRIAQEIGMI